MKTSDVDSRQHSDLHVIDIFDASVGRWGPARLRHPLTVGGSLNNDGNWKD